MEQKYIQGITTKKYSKDRPKPTIQKKNNKAQKVGKKG